MPVKIVYSFDEGGNGTSETYYRNDSDVDAYFGTSFLNPVSPFANFLLARRALMPPTAQITHVRVSLLGSPQNCRPQAVTPLDGTGFYAVPRLGLPFPAPAAEVFSELLVRFRAGATRRRSMWLKCIPEDIVQAPRTYNPTGTWEGPFNTFIRLLVNGSYGVAGRPKIADVPPAVPITSFIVLASGLQAEIGPLIAPAGPPTSWFVVVRGVRQPRGWNGVHRAVISANANHFLIGPTRRAGVSTPLYSDAPVGTVQLLAYPFAGFTGIDAERLTPRKVGRPFGAPRGRR